MLFSSAITGCSLLTKKPEPISVTSSKIIYFSKKNSFPYNYVFFEIRDEHKYQNETSNKINSKMAFFSCGNPQEYNGILWEHQIKNGTSRTYKFIEKITPLDFLYSVKSNQLQKIDFSSPAFKQIAEYACKNQIDINEYDKDKSVILQKIYVDHAVNIGADPLVYSLKCKLYDVSFRYVRDQNLEISPLKKQVESLNADFSDDYGINRIIAKSDKIHIEITNNSKIQISTKHQLLQGFCTKI